MNIQTISIVGSGNVATNLASNLVRQNFTIVEIIGRNLTRVTELANHVHANSNLSFKNIKPCDLLLLCVPDDEIEKVILQLDTSIPIAYTSGTKNLQDIKTTGQIGVFYPLQTFSIHHIIDTKTIPFFVESSHKEFQEKLLALGNKIGLNAQVVQSLDRKEYHIAAVFLNNFTNHLAHIAKTIIEKQHLNWDNLIPLFKETVKNISEKNPKEIQTGPAKRRDYSTIENHLTSLSGIEKEVYEIITKSIIHSYHEKL